MGVNEELKPMVAPAVVDVNRVMDDDVKGYG